MAAGVGYPSSSSSSSAMAPSFYDPPVKVLIHDPIINDDKRTYYIISTPFAKSELDQLVPPASTSTTGMNCAILGYYTCGLVSADVAKYYSDQLVLALQRVNARIPEKMDVESENRFFTILQSDEKFTDRTLQVLHAQIFANLQGAYGLPVLLSVKDVDAPTVLLRLVQGMPVGHITPIVFQRSFSMKKGQGSHAIAVWKEAPDTAHLIDIQRGFCTAGGRCSAAYGKWQTDGSELSRAIQFKRNYFLVTFTAGSSEAESLARMQETFVRYMVRQGMLWDYYDPDVKEDAMLKGDLSPRIQFLGVRKLERDDVNLYVYKIPHNNALLAADRHSDPYQSILNNQMVVVNSRTLQEDRASFHNSVVTMPVLIARRPFVIRDPKNPKTLISNSTRLTPGNYELRVVGVSLPINGEVRGPNGNVFYVITTRLRTIAQSFVTISGRGRRRLLSAPTRRAKRSSSLSTKGYTRRQRALRS